MTTLAAIAVLILMLASAAPVLLLFAAQAARHGLVAAIFAAKLVGLMIDLAVDAAGCFLDA